MPAALAQDHLRMALEEVMPELVGNRETLEARIARRGAVENRSLGPHHQEHAAHPALVCRQRLDADTLGRSDEERVNGQSGHSVPAGNLLAHLLRHLLAGPGRSARVQGDSAFCAASASIITWIRSRSAALSSSSLRNAVVAPAMSGLVPSK